ncbi:MAG: M2 family metallopeptidase [Deltaproteobacteria bacterium]|nr:M2 family metallopeptidase [Deltaproteobacteria bacterium]
MKPFPLALATLLTACTPLATGPGPEGAAAEPLMDVEPTARAFVTDWEARLAPLARSLALASWKAMNDGDSAAYEEAARLDLEIRRMASDRASFQRLQAWKDHPDLQDPILRRQVEIAWETFAANQVDPALLEKTVALASEVEQAFNTFRGKVGDQEISSNEIYAVLGQSTDSAERRAAWEASKQVGPLVAARVIELAKLRNQAAREVGFRTFWEMQLTLGEQDPAAVTALFDEMAQDTREPFLQVKADLDRVLAARLKVKPADLEPWHYADPFFQEAPSISEVDLDTLYAGKDVRALVEGFYTSIGLETAPILDRSDLFARPGKQPHAFCNHLDREGDVRISANLESNEQWVGTLLHELGHGVYDANLDFTLPWSLRMPAHTFTTEAVAELFGRLSKDPEFIVRAAGVPRERVTPLSEDLRRTRRLQALVFARWSAVMVHFERSFYEDPDQDLDTLWWDLVERYQGLTRPEGRAAPDWAAKIHVVTVPAYYHNYLMGEMLASQILNALSHDVLGGAQADGGTLWGNPEVGRWMIQHLFQPGARWRWEEFVERATEDTLSPRYFAEEFVQG